MYSWTSTAFNLIFIILTSRIRIHFNFTVGSSNASCMSRFHSKSSQPSFMKVTLVVPWKKWKQISKWSPAAILNIQFATILVAREFRLYMDFDILTRAYMQFYLIWVHFPHTTNLKWIFSNVKFNSESIGGVVFPDTCTHLLLNEQFLTLTFKDVS